MIVDDIQNIPCFPIARAVCNNKETSKRESCELILHLELEHPRCIHKDFLLPIKQSLLRQRRRVFDRGRKRI